MGQLERAQAFLDYMTDEGVWRTIGTVRVLNNDASNSLRFEPRGRVQLLQRRAYVRTDCVAAVMMMPPGGAPCRCLTLNVSGGGFNSIIAVLVSLEPDPSGNGNLLASGQMLDGGT